MFGQLFGGHERLRIFYSTEDLETAAPHLMQINDRLVPDRSNVCAAESAEGAKMMRISTVLVAAALIHGAAALPNVAVAQTQTKAQQCQAYARQAADSASSTGGGRGAARGAAGAAIAGGDAAKGAAVGAVVGGVRGNAQENRAYESYYNECMSR